MPRQAKSLEYTLSFWCWLAGKYWEPRFIPEILLVWAWDWCTKSARQSQNPTRFHESMMTIWHTVLFHWTDAGYWQMEHRFGGRISWYLSNQGGNQRNPIRGEEVKNSYLCTWFDVGNLPKVILVILWMKIWRYFVKWFALYLMLPLL